MDALLSPMIGCRRRPMYVWSLITSMTKITEKYSCASHVLSYLLPNQSEKQEFQEGGTMLSEALGLP